jgi:hypothetical protein
MICIKKSKSKLNNNSNNNKAYDYGGHNAYNFGGHPAPSGRALPNLINAVRMFKVNVKTNLFISAKANVFI